MNSQKIQQSTNNIQNKLSEDLKNSEVSVAIKDESISGETFADSQSNIIPESIELNDVVDKQEFQNFADVLHSKKVKDTCWLDEDGFRVCKKP